jgi:hypothetical protein
MVMMVMVVMMVMIVASRNPADIEMMMVMMVMIAVVVMVVLRKLHVSVLAGLILRTRCGRRVDRPQRCERIRDWVKQLRERPCAGHPIRTRRGRGGALRGVERSQSRDRADDTNNFLIHRVSPRVAYLVGSSRTMPSTKQRQPLFPESRQNSQVSDCELLMNNGSANTDRRRPVTLTERADPHFAVAGTLPFCL